jgi:hypothetical protein
MLRWIDELNGIVDADARAKEIRKEIRALRKEPNSVQNKHKVGKLYCELDRIQFKPDYMCLIIDSTPDYYRACKGFTINGVEYTRLLGTNGGIKNNTIVFVSTILAAELRRRIDNGRDQTKELVTAKLEAYKALTCSASTPVSLPNGILIVNDAETKFLSEVINLTDEFAGEPVMEYNDSEEIVLNASDGYGLMLPSLAERWSSDLDLGYTTCGVNTRFSWEKGMVFTFDFIDFADKIAGKYIVKDAWGNDVDIRNVELILTTSMVKLWDSYDSCESYISNSLKNGYTFGVSKTCVKELESERNLNYQFIQSYNLTDDDIDELIQPTMQEIEEVLGGDWRKSILFLKGAGLNENNVPKLRDDFIKAIMIDPNVLNDPFVQNNIYQLIQNRINEAKVGVLKVHGNYSMVLGDPFLLCQSIFGLEPTGLLKAGEVYNKYWIDHPADVLACFRAPMTCHNNIRLVKPSSDDDTKYWYKHLTACTVLNSWDTSTAALNGCDFDGDLVMLTDNSVLVRKHRQLPSLMCAQRKAQKRVSTELDFIKSNIESFGSEIGQTTNWITSMFEVQAGFDPESEEYKTLEYRIMCGQLFQQNVIDKSKGIISKPMPHYWHNRRSVAQIEDEDTREMNYSIVADKKPYFMRYIYPQLMKQYNTYIQNTQRNSLREFGLTVSELLELPDDSLTDRQREFIFYYNRHMPVGVNDCVMNKICRKFEDKFDGHVSKHNTKTTFDYTFMKSDSDYSRKQFDEIKKLYANYNRQLATYSVYADCERISDIDTKATLQLMNDEFLKECSKICPNSDELCNILLDICYSKKNTKRFVWNMCGRNIIHNLLSRNNNIMRFPVLDNDGEISYCGQTYTIQEIILEEDFE